MTEEMWQLYDNQGRALAGQGATKDNVYGNGLLHEASHVWIYRQTPDGTEVLLQKRAANKRTWPNRYDISAAGHIDLGEEPVTAALRETKEEIGLAIDAEDLKLISVQRAYIVAENGAIENEYQWLYVLRLDAEASFNLQMSEVASVEWLKLTDLETNISRSDQSDYVPHGSIYYQTVISAIKLGAE